MTKREPKVETDSPDLPAASLPRPAGPRSRSWRPAILTVAGIALLWAIYLAADKGVFRVGDEARASLIPGSGGTTEAVPPALPDDSPVARLVEWIEDAEPGSFGVLAISRPGEVSTGTVFLMLRNGEFLCRLRVQEADDDEAIAQVIGSIPKPPPRADDVLTLDKSGK